MAGTVVADTLRADSTSTLVLRNGVASTPPTVQDSAGTEIGTFCRAWVNFNGTGTVAIRASFNVTSITDNGTGDYTVNFTNAMPDVNYVPVFFSDANSAIIISQPTTIATGSVRFTSKNGAGTAFDGTNTGVSIFR
jgi:hypothetical protein